jgi:hypothetical protein
MKIRLHHEAHEGHEGFIQIYTFKLRALASFVVKSLFLIWLRLCRVGFFSVKKCLASVSTGMGKTRQLYFFSTSRAMTMRMTSEAPSVIMRLR